MEDLTTRRVTELWAEHHHTLGEADRKNPMICGARKVRGLYEPPARIWSGQGWEGEAGGGNGMWVNKNKKRRIVLRKEDGSSRWWVCVCVGGGVLKVSASKNIPSAGLYYGAQKFFLASHKMTESPVDLSNTLWIRFIEETMHELRQYYEQTKLPISSSLTSGALLPKPISHMLTGVLVWDGGGFFKLLSEYTFRNI